MALDLNTPVSTSPTHTPAELLASAQQSHVADPAANAAATAAAAALTFAAGAIDTGTDMTAAEAAAIVTDFAAQKVELDKLIADVAAGKTATDANNSTIDAILATLEATQLHATS